VLEKVAVTLNIENKEGREHLSKRMATVFQEHSMSIFSLTDDQIDSVIKDKYLPKLENMEFESEERKEEAQELLDDNINSPDFKKFFRAVMRLSLHMFLNDPPIQVATQTIVERNKQASKLDKFDFWMYSKNDYYCIDGFPKEGNPCAIVLPPPYRQGYIYQGIKPAVVVIDSAS
jgi:hypothetical protein